MVTVSHIVKKIVSDNDFLLEALSKGLLNHVHFAESIEQKVQAELKKKVELPAIIMALRRYQEELSEAEKEIVSSKLSGQIIIKTNIVDYNVKKTPSLLASLKKFYSVVAIEQGDDFSTVIGNNEVSIILNEKYAAQTKKLLQGEKILTTEKDLVALTIKFNENDFLHTPGTIFSAVRKLAWEQINILEIVSTMTELTFILGKKDSMKAYDVLSEIVS